jgi:hypothetical protein
MSVLPCPLLHAAGGGAAIPAGGSAPHGRPRAVQAAPVPYSWRVHG